MREDFKWCLFTSSIPLCPRPVRACAASYANFLYSKFIFLMMFFGVTLLSLLAPTGLWLCVLTLIKSKMSFILTLISLLPDPCPCTSACAWTCLDFGWQNLPFWTGPLTPHPSPLCSWCHLACLFKRSGHCGSRLSRLLQTFFPSAKTSAILPLDVIMLRRPPWLDGWASSVGSVWPRWAEALLQAPEMTELRPLSAVMPSPTICSLILVSCPCVQRASGPEGSHVSDDPPTLRIPLFNPFCAQLTLNTDRQAPLCC